MKTSTKFLYAGIAGLLISCSSMEDPRVDPIDRAAKLNRADYQNYLSPESQTKTEVPASGETEVNVKVEKKVPPLPKISEVLINPPKPKVGKNKVVSISVTEDVPLKDVFLELAKLADVDIEVDPTITGGVIFKATNKPFAEVVDRISELADLRYSEKDGVLRIERDAPFVESYQASYLNLIRTNNSQIAVNTTVLGSDSGGSSDSESSSSSSSSSSSGSNGAATGSQTAINSNNGGDGDLWGSLEKQINAILGKSGQQSAAPTTDDSFVSLNREASLITVKASARNHERVKQYLKQVQDHYSSQVLIEAKVIEVALNDQFRSGIDWSFVSKNGLLGLRSIQASSLQGFPSEGFTGAAGVDNLAKISFESGDISAAVELAQIFGTTRTLSSPRILVMNNQQAVLSFATNQNYFTVACETTITPGSGGSDPITQQSVTSTLHTIPVGVILNLQSSIDSKHNEVSMNIRPTLSRLTGKTIADPASSACGSDITSLIPQIDVREMDSILRLKSGEIMAIGGMIDQKANNTDTGVPWISEVPIIGNAFKTVDKQNQTIQTVIFLKATVVPGYGVDDKDKEMYNKFNTDPRPFKF